MKKLLGTMIVGAALVLGGCGDNAAKEGDIVIIDYAGYLDGVQFPRGTDTGFALKLGSRTFVPGFEEQLIGAKKGETRDVNITFPTNYVPELAGKDVVFKVTVVDIKK